MMSASTGFSISGTQTSAPVALATGATAPTWSKCVCVRRMPSSFRFSCSRASRSFGASSPGSTISARSEPSRRRMYVFSATGPTVNMRTSMALRLAPALLLLALAAAVQRAVRVVAHRDVEQHRHEAQEHARDDVLLHDADEGREDHRGEGGSVDGAAPGRLLVEAVRAPLGGGHARACLGLGLGARTCARGPARAAGAIDRAGLGAAVLATPALLLRLGHGLLRSLTLPRWSGSRCPRGRLSARGRRARCPPPRPSPRRA